MAASTGLGATSAPPDPEEPPDGALSISSLTATSVWPAQVAR